MNNVIVQKKKKKKVAAGVNEATQAQYKCEMVWNLHRDECGRCSQATC